jgi:deoxyribonuclease IV
MLQLGGHVDPADPIAEAKARNADLVQFFLADPQGWKAPLPRADAVDLKASGITLYVHAPYVINVATTNNRIRIPSRKLLQQHCDAAADIGAAAVIVHGGHVADDSELDVGVDNWRKTVERLESRVPVLLENTAGGNHAMARRFANLARLWDAIGASGIGFCLDTCHAHAAGEDLAGAVERIRAITGRIDLVHCNDSKDPLGSGRDRHEHLGSGTIDPDMLAEVVRNAGAPVVCETPPEGQKDDIAWVREQLG